MKNDRLPRRAIPAGTAPVCPDAPMPPEVAAFSPDAIRLWTNGPPAVRRMVEWIVVASDRELVVIAEEMERQYRAVTAPNISTQGDAA